MEPALPGVPSDTERAEKDEVWQAELGSFRRELFIQLAALHSKVDDLDDWLRCGAAAARPPRHGLGPLVQTADKEQTEAASGKLGSADGGQGAAHPADLRDAAVFSTRQFDMIHSMLGGEAAPRRVTRRQSRDAFTDVLPVSFATPRTRACRCLPRFFGCLGADPSTQHSGCYKFIHGSWFQLFVSTIIIMNTVVFGITAEQRMHGELGPWQQGFAQFFLIFFVAELTVRVSIEGLLFFTGEEWKWNLLDVALVSESLVSSILNNHNWKTSLIRVLRMLRFVRLARLSRVVRHMRALRMVLFAMLDSMSSLFWCFVVVGIITYVFAVVFVTEAAEYVYNEPDATPENIEALRLWYGSVPRAMITLFMVVSGGADGTEVVMPLKACSAMIEPLFIFFVFIAQFGVLNIITGTFAANAAEVAEKDRDSRVELIHSKMKEESLRIKTFFHEADLDRSGTLSWEEFEKHMQDWRVRAYFQSLDLDISHAHVLFSSLDVDTGGCVTIDEFVDGVSRLKGNARSLDLHVLTVVVERVQKRMSDFAKDTEQRLRTIQARLAAQGGTGGGLPPPAPPATPPPLFATLNAQD